MVGWIARYQRELLKNKRLLIRKNVRAYRTRQRAAQIRRVDIALSESHYERLLAFMAPNESYSAAMMRVIDGVSGNKNQMEQIPKNQTVNH